MLRSHSFGLILAFGVALFLATHTARAQSRRTLAPGVLTVIDPTPEPKETYTGPMPLSRVVKKHPEIDFTPNLSEKTATVFKKGQSVTLRRKVWTLEFAFKPLRMVLVDVPEAPGVIKRKLVWYMAYRVRNTGEHLAPTAQEDENGQITYTADRAASKAYFIPHFVLEGEYFDKETGKYVRKAYLDRVIPEARVPIQRREDPLIPLRNSVQMMSKPLAQPSSSDEVSDANSAWGVVTWMDVNANIDYVSIYVQGLTNAFEYSELPDGRSLHRHKTLQLNFWRPGDQYLEHEQEFRYGVRIVKDPEQQQEIFGHYQIPERLDHRWIYR